MSKRIATKDGESPELKSSAKKGVTRPVTSRQSMAAKSVRPWSSSTITKWPRGARSTKSGGSNDGAAPATSAQMTARPHSALRVAGSAILSSPQKRKKASSKEMPRRDETLVR
jgi:hypothetical protein